MYNINQYYRESIRLKQKWQRKRTGMFNKTIIPETEQLFLYWYAAFQFFSNIIRKKILQMIEKVSFLAYTLMVM